MKKINTENNKIADESTISEGSRRRNLKGMPRVIAFILGFSLTIITFYTAFQGTFLPMIQRGLHLCILLALSFLWYPATKNSNKNKPSFLDYICAAISIFILFWTIINNQRFVLRIPYYSPMTIIDIVTGTTLVILTLEAGRRTLGLILTILTGIFILYGFAGPYLPGMLVHPGMSISKFIDQLYLTAEGMFSGLMGLSATVLFMFVAFGTFLQGTGADKFYINLCLAISGKSPGGPAKVAVISSGLMGTITGSTIANVVTTGNLTIPLMKKTGYLPHEAGAIETAASAAGIIMPPIMGCSAFIMAEILGIRYFDIVKVAFIPALLFYLTVWFFVDTKARKKKIAGLKEEEVPNFKEEFKKGGMLFLPIAALLLFLIRGYTPFYAGFTSTILLLVVNAIRKDRISIKKFIETIEKCSINMTSITGIIACACIVVAMIKMTGLMMKTTAIILHLSGGILILTIIFEAIMAYILGMGLPIGTSYIILSTLGGPALIQLGVYPLSAHLMILYFCNLATITPPICMTAFAAAEIAKADPMKTGWAALKLGSPFYFIPILFIFSNILVGNLYQTIFIAVIAAFAIKLFVSGIEGYLYKNLSIFERIFMVVSAVTLYSVTFRNVPLFIKMIFIIYSVFVYLYVYIKNRNFNLKFSSKNVFSKKVNKTKNRINNMLTRR